MQILLKHGAYEASLIKMEMPNGTFMSLMIKKCGILLVHTLLVNEQQYISDNFNKRFILDYIHAYEYEMNDYYNMRAKKILISKCQSISKMRYNDNTR